MADIDDILTEMRRSPANVRFANACKVAAHYFGAARQRGTSRLVWRMPWPGDPRVNLQRSKGGKAKVYQVRQLLQAIDRLSEERSGGTLGVTGR